MSYQGDSNVITEHKKLKSKSHWRRRWRRRIACLFCSSCFWTMPVSPSPLCWIVDEGIKPWALLFIFKSLLELFNTQKITNKQKNIHPCASTRDFPKKLPRNKWKKGYVRPSVRPSIHPPARLLSVYKSIYLSIYLYIITKFSGAALPSSGWCLRQSHLRHTHTYIYIYI